MLFLLHQRVLERGANPRHGLFLRIDVEAGRARLRDQQCATAVRGKPHALAFVRPSLPLQSVDHLQHLAGGVARQEITDQHAGRRGQQVELLLQATANAVRGKPLRVNRRTEQIAIAQQEFAIGAQTVLRAIGHIDEPLVLFQPRRQRLAECRELALFAAFDSDQDQARHHALPQFIDQEALRRRRRTRQERSQVRAVLRTRHDDRAGNDKSQPDADAQARRRNHGTSS